MTPYEEAAPATARQPEDLADHRRRRLHRLEFAGDPAQARSARGGAGQFRDRLSAQSRRGGGAGRVRLQWARFNFIEGDICALDDCRRACEGVDYVLHQAALGSVPRSLADPIATNAANVTGFLNMLVAARDAKVQRFVYAASSSHLRRSSRPAQGRGRHRRAAQPLCRHQICERALCRRVRALLWLRRRSACATSMSSARGRTPTAPMPR